MCWVEQVQERCYAKVIVGATSKLQSYSLSMK